MENALEKNDKLDHRRRGPGVTLEFVGQVRMVVVATFESDILQTSIRDILLNHRMRVLVADKVAEFFWGNTDLLFEKSFKLA